MTDILALRGAPHPAGQTALASSAAWSSRPASWHQEAGEHRDVLAAAEGATPCWSRP